jgi:hypothetical protein
VLLKVKQNNVESSKAKLEMESVGPLSPHNEALYETGKEMLKGSISTGRDFCKFMITVSTGAIPIYLGLLKFVLPENITLSLSKLFLSVVPPFFFLISAIVFILGYFPQVDYFSLDIINQIKQAYEKTVIKRKKFINFGIILFLIGTVFAIMSIVIHIIR